MKIKENVTLYQCDFCRKYYQIKRFAILHEEICKKNPENFRACFGCKYLIKKEVEIHEDHPVGGSFTYKRDVLFCNKKIIFLYPPTVEHKGSAFDLGYSENEPMPKNCDEFNNSFDDLF